MLTFTEEGKISTKVFKSQGKGSLLLIEKVEQLNEKLHLKLKFLSEPFCKKPGMTKSKPRFIFPNKSAPHSSLVESDNDESDD